jgi:hypothetical protein
MENWYIFSQVLHKFHDKLMKNIFIESIFIDESFTYLFYLLANEVAKGYSNATFRVCTKFGQNPLKDVDSSVHKDVMLSGKKN